MSDNLPKLKLSPDQFLRTPPKSEGQTKAVQQVVKKYGPVLDDFTDVVFIADEAGCFVFVNKACERVNGVSAEVFLGRHFSELIDPKDQEIANNNFHKILKGDNNVPPMEMQRQIASGETVFKEVNWTVLSGNNAAKFVMGVSRDVTDRKLAQEVVKRARDELEMRVQERTAELQESNDLLTKQIFERLQAEQKLKESEEKYRGLFENSGDSVFIVDVETGKILDANRQAEELTGRPRQELIGMHQSQLHPSRDAEYYLQKFQKHIASERVFDLEAEVVQKNGSVVPVFIYSTLIDLQGKKVIQGIFRDLSKEKIISDLQDELKSKKLVNRAKAIIANHYNINESDALKLLQRESRRQNRKMHEVAEAVISSEFIVS